MNNNYMPPYYDPSSSTAPPMTNGVLPTENQVAMPYSDNVLSWAKGQYGHFYMSFPDSLEWRDRVFSGFIERVGKDFVAINNREENKWYLLYTVYLNYVIFDENQPERKINF